MAVVMFSYWAIGLELDKEGDKELRCEEKTDQSTFFRGKRSEENLRVEKETSTDMTMGKWSLVKESGWTCQLEEGRRNGEMRVRSIAEVLVLGGVIRVGEPSFNTVRS